MQKTWRIVIECGNSLKNHDGLRMLEGYWYLLPIIRYKHQRYQGGMLMASYTSMYIRSKKGIKMRMETTIGLYGKENEIIYWHSPYVGLCLILNSNCCCMHVIVETRYTKFVWVGLVMITFANQGSKIISSDDDIHLSLCMVGEKVGNFSLYVSSIFWHDNYNNTLKHIMGCNVFTFARAT